MNQQQRIALFVLVLAGFVTIFDLFVVNVAIVSIERSLQANFTELTLIIAGYELAFGLLLITGGRLGDIYGRRRLYQAGMAFFTLASLLCAAAPTALFCIRQEMNFCRMRINRCPVQQISAFSPAPLLNRRWRIWQKRTLLRKRGRWNAPVQPAR